MYQRIAIDAVVKAAYKQAAVTDSLLIKRIGMSFCSEEHMQLIKVGLRQQLEVWKEQNLDSTKVKNQ